MIEPLFVRTNAVLPTVYENSLSYYEVLCKVAYKLNEVIEQVNALSGGDVQPIQPAQTQETTIPPAHPQERERTT